MRPFKELRELFGAAIPNASPIALAKAKIRKLCSYKPDDDLKLQAIKQAILFKIDSRLPYSEIVKLQEVLDFETKTLILRKTATELLEQAAKKCIDKQLIVNVTNSEPDKAESLDDGDDQAVKRKRMRLEMLNELKAASAVNENDSARGYVVEIARYLSFNDNGQAEDSLGFLKSHVCDFPVLSQVAQVYLAASASPVPVESMFSTCGLVMNFRRSALSVEKLNKIVFIHDNIKFTV